MDTAFQCKGMEKLHSLNHIPDEAAAEQKESFSDEEMDLLDPEELFNSDEVVAQIELEELESLNLIPDEAAAANEELFSDEEMDSLDPEVPINSGEVAERNSITPDAVKCEYEEITIEETRITDANYENKRPREPKMFNKCPAVKFSCCSCTSSYNSIDELRAHGREKHCDTHLEGFNLMDRQCEICFNVFSDKRAYDIHRTNVMYNYRCKICDEIISTLKQTFVHKAVKHPPAKLKKQPAWRNPTADEALRCCACKMQFRSATALKIHSETIHLPAKHPPDEKKPVTCNICYRNFTTKYKLREHKIRYLKQKNHHCKHCGKSFLSLSELLRHATVHRKFGIVKRSQIYRCKKCGKSCSTFPVLLRHEESHITPVTLDHATTRENVMNNHRCWICDEIQITLEEAVAHYQLKHAQRPLMAKKALMCCGCKMQCRSTEELEIHSKMIHLPKKHSPDERKPITCNICYRNYASKSTLAQHKLSRWKNYHCECGKSFRRPSELISHRKKSHVAPVSSDHIQTR